MDTKENPNNFLIIEYIVIATWYSFIVFNSKNI